MVDIDISRNSSQNILGVLKGDFWGFGCPNDAQMPCWLRLCMRHYDDLNVCFVVGDSSITCIGTMMI